MFPVCKSSLSVNANDVQVMAKSSLCGGTLQDQVRVELQSDQAIYGACSCQTVTAARSQRYTFKFAPYNNFGHHLPTFFNATMWPGHSGYSHNRGMPTPGASYHSHQQPSGYPPPSAPPPQFPPGGYAAPRGPPPFSGQYAPPLGPPAGSAGYPYGGNTSPTGPYYAPPGPPPMPPVNQQSYTFQSGQGAPPQPAYFQYSQCNGKRKGLLIGVNYIGQPEALQGCIEDVHRMKRFLQGRGFREEDLVVLTDTSPHPRSQPTRQNIIDAMYWLVRDARPNDSLFFHYSGHGGQTKDLDGDEEDGFDEVIYPVDFKMTSHIVDDDMHRIMVRDLPAGCRLTAIFDSCHSGSALDLPYMYSTEGKIKEPNMALGAAQGLFSTFASFERSDLSGMVRGVTDLVKVASGSVQKANAYTKATRTSAADVISWSGCKDSQTSADAQIGGRSTGAMSDAFLTALERNPNPSYQQLLVDMRWILHNKYSQKPQLSSSHPMDTNLQFIV